jgi:hypothetical protein
MYELDYLMISLVMNDEHIGFDLERNPRLQILTSPRHALSVLLVNLVIS